MKSKPKIVANSKLKLSPASLKKNSVMNTPKIANVLKKAATKKR